MSTPEWQTLTLPERYDYKAPDGSEIRLLPAMTRGSVSHCRLPAGKVTRPVRHRHVEEIWFVLQGRGQLWRRSGETEEVAAMAPGNAFTIPAGTDFQFRAAARSELVILITTMPPWPGKEEALASTGPWAPTVESGPDVGSGGQ